MNPGILVRRTIAVMAPALACGAFLWAVLPRDAGVAPRSAVVETAPGRSDVQLFARIVEDLRKGQPYYEATGSELRAGGYPTRSIFNWRQPLLYLALSRVPLLLAQIALALLAAKLVWDASRTLPRETLAVVPMLSSATALLVPVAIYLTEAWAGVCIGLSLLAYARNRERTGAMWGLTALFVRELAAPYCLVAGCLALWRRRWHEVGMWAAGGVCYVVYYGIHATQALSHIRPDDAGHLNSWVAFGGLPFLAETLRVNGLLLLAPRFTVAIVAAALAAAWWNRHLPLHARVTLVLYGGLFLVVGLPFNAYWGLLIAPAVSMWLPYGWGGFRELWYPANLSPAPTANAAPSLALD